MYSTKPVWQQWPHKERAQRRPGRPRKQVVGGRWYVMKAPTYLARNGGRRWVALNGNGRMQCRWFTTWQEAWDYAVVTTRLAYIDVDRRRR